MRLRSLALVAACALALAVGATGCHQVESEPAPSPEPASLPEPAPAPGAAPDAPASPGDQDARPTSPAGVAPVPAEWPAGAQWVGDPPPDPIELAAHPERFAAQLEEEGLGLDVAGRTVSARGGTLHDSTTLEYPVEYVLVTDRGRTHEALFVLKARPSILEACLLAVGLRPGAPMHFRLKDDAPTQEELNAGVSPWEPVPGSGPLVSITIAWTDDSGAPRQGSLESMLVDVRTREALPERDWIFVGGRFGPLRRGREVVQTHVADLAGNVVAIYLDGEGQCLFERNSLDGLDDSLYTINSATTPRRGTPVTIVFAPTGEEVAPPPPPPSQDVVAGELGSRLDAALVQAAARGFSGAVHIARGGHTVLEKGYGATAAERGAPITGATVFPLGPLSRRILAAAVLRAGADGKLALDARINTVLRNVPVDKVDLTARQLLEQRSGLPATVQQAATIDRTLALRAIMDAALAAAPGERCLPSEAGDALLVATLEDAAEDTWRGYLGEHVFDAARMTGADLCGQPRWEESRLALGDQGRGGLGSPATNAPEWPVLAAAGVVASVRDLGRFERWLDPESAAFAPPCDDESQPWRITSGAHGRYLIAAGRSPGFRAELRRWLDEDTLLIVLSNVEEPDVADELEALLLAEPPR